MSRNRMTRRRLITTLVAVAAGPRVTRRAFAEDLSLPANLPEETWRFDGHGIENWKIVAGQWAVEAMAGASSGNNVLVQRATKNEFNVIVAPPGPFTDVEVTMKFHALSGRQDASGASSFASPTASIMSSARTRSRTTSGSTPTTVDAGSWRARP
jgi:hypothetical protein